VSATAPSRVRWQRLTGPDEDWGLVLLGVVAVLVAVGLGLLTAVSAHDRDVRLADAAATEQRLAANGVDDNLTSDLIRLQQDEVTLFQGHVDFASSPALDPNDDVSHVQADLAAATSQIGDSARVRNDVALITNEIPGYVRLEAMAFSDNQQGLPVGAAYLRDASGYLRDHILPAAADIRGVDQARLAADDADAAGIPTVLVIAAVLGLACLAAVQVVLARRTHRLVNPGLLAAAVLVTVLVAWSLPTTLVSRNQVATGAIPHAVTATDLARVQDGATQAGLDDRLTLADHGEDCTTLNSTQNADVTCTYEQDALDRLTTGCRPLPCDTLPVDLATAGRDGGQDPAIGRLLTTARTETATWFTDENRLPTLQNLATNAKKIPQGEVPRYDSTFKRDVLDPYTRILAIQPAINDYTALRNTVRQATALEWSDYTTQAGDAGDALGGLVTGGLLLGLLAGAAAGAGVAWRVAEYWSMGRSGA
jgi:hypothetical protein